MKTYEKLRLLVENKNYKLSKTTISRLIKCHRHLIRDLYKDTGKVYYNSIPILKSFERVVCGAHGPYIEFKEKDLLIELEVTKGQEWRVDDEYSHIKYNWLNPINLPDIKIYYQKNKVSYADYRPGYYYIDFYNVEIKPKAVLF